MGIPTGWESISKGFCQARPSLRTSDKERAAHVSQVGLHEDGQQRCVRQGEDMAAEVDGGRTRLVYNDGRRQLAPQSVVTREPEEEEYQAGISETGPWARS